MIPGKRLQLYYETSSDNNRWEGKEVVIFFLIKEIINLILVTALDSEIEQLDK